MRFMNSHDIDYARRRFDPATTPNRAALVLVVDNLRRWADDNSDGWAYWPKPCRAAATAMGHIASTTNADNDFREANDITTAQLRAAVSPIKAMLTRTGATPDDRERITRPATL